MSLSQVSKDILEGDKGIWDSIDDASTGTRSSGNIEASYANNSTTDTNQSGTTDDDIQNIKNALTKRESQQVFRLRILVMLILIAAAASISMTIFHLQKNSQLEEFESDYYGVAEKVVDALQKVTESISAISGIAVTATVDAQNQLVNVSALNTKGVSEWPFITIDAFQERASNAIALAGSIFVSLNPLVQLDQLSDWQKYVESDVSSWM